ncbi:MAG: PD-(D/E)XK nuclease family protein [Oscillatoriaceae bacterium SKW80]|nr:PD-(D/E)XK nuclease family protein [Oscillatoriaceae bacterium SKW80]HIK27714.1 PD-(D/E)XK nuclease family protein [Oscillatoriaceae cyanobacterium M7585_C2015_266]
MIIYQRLLNLLETCPRKFQHIYLEQLDSPLTPAQQERPWGSRFHLLMQQRELGLPIDLLVRENSQMKNCFTAFLKAAPEIFAPNRDSETFRQAEYSRTMDFKGYVLTVVYDLLIADAKKAQILDWKTYPHPQEQQKLAQNWQTRLYLYVLAETSEYLPEQISMTYWFVRTNKGERPQRLNFDYNKEQHKKTEKYLTMWLERLKDWLDKYMEKGEQFPQVDPNSRKCIDCKFAIRCERSRIQKEEAIALTAYSNLANIEEICL